MVVLSLTFVVITIVTGLLLSKHRFNMKIQNLSKILLLSDKTQI